MRPPSFQALIHYPPKLASVTPTPPRQRSNRSECQSILSKIVARWLTKRAAPDFESTIRRLDPPRPSQAPWRPGRMPLDLRCDLQLHALGLIVQSGNADDLFERRWKEKPANLALRRCLTEKKCWSLGVTRYPNTRLSHAGCTADKTFVGQRHPMENRAGSLLLVLVNSSLAVSLPQVCSRPIRPRCCSSGRCRSELSR